MITEQCRLAFEEKFPVPDGVFWDGESYNGNRGVVGSFTNASYYDERLRGFASIYADMATAEAGRGADIANRRTLAEAVLAYEEGTPADLSAAWRDIIGLARELAK